MKQKLTFILQFLNKQINVSGICFQTRSNIKVACVFIVFITFLAVLHTTAGTRQNWILNPWYNKTIYQRNNEHLGTLASRIWQLLSMCISNTLYMLYRIYFHTAKNTVYYIYLCPDTYLSLLLKLKKKSMQYTIPCQKCNDYLF